MAKTGRDDRGRFAPGNSGGPGRPKRAVELEYIKALADTVTLDDWRAVCQSALEAAKAGDAKAREWLAGYLIGAKAKTLSELAYYEALGIDGATLVEASVRQVVDPKCQDPFAFNCGAPTLLDIALGIAASAE